MGIQPSLAQARSPGNVVHAAGVVAFFGKTSGGCFKYGLPGLLSLQDSFVAFSFRHGEGESGLGEYQFRLVGIYHFGPGIVKKYGRPSSPSSLAPTPGLNDNNLLIYK